MNAEGGRFFRPTGEEGGCPTFRLGKTKTASGTSSAAEWSSVLRDRTISPGLDPGAEEEKLEGQETGTLTVEK